MLVICLYERDGFVSFIRQGMFTLYGKHKTTSLMDILHPFPIILDVVDVAGGR